MYEREKDITLDEKIFNYFIYTAERIKSIGYNFDNQKNSAEDRIKYLKEIIFVLENESRTFTDLKKEFEGTLDTLANL